MAGRTGIGNDGRRGVPPMLPVALGRRMLAGNGTPVLAMLARGSVDGAAGRRPLVIGVVMDELRLGVLAGVLENGGRVVLSGAGARSSDSGRPVNTGHKPWTISGAGNIFPTSVRHGVVRNTQPSVLKQSPSPKSKNDQKT